MKYVFHNSQLNRGASFNFGRFSLAVTSSRHVSEGESSTPEHSPDWRKVSREMWLYKRPAGFLYVRERYPLAGLSGFAITVDVTRGLIPPTFELTY